MELYGKGDEFESSRCTGTWFKEEVVLVTSLGVAINMGWLLEGKKGHVR